MNMLEIIVLIIIAISCLVDISISFCHMGNPLSYRLFRKTYPPVWCYSGEVFRLYRKTCRRKNTGTGT